MCLLNALFLNRMCCIRGSHFTLAGMGLRSSKITKFFDYYF